MTMATAWETKVEEAIATREYNGLTNDECLALAGEVGEFTTRTFIDQYEESFVEITWVDGSTVVISAE